MYSHTYVYMYACTYLSVCCVFHVFSSVHQFLCSYLFIQWFTLLKLIVCVCTYVCKLAVHMCVSASIVIYVHAYWPIQLCCYSFGSHVACLLACLHACLPACLPPACLPGCPHAYTHIHTYTVTYTRRQNSYIILQTSNHPSMHGDNFNIISKLQEMSMLNSMPKSVGRRLGSWCSWIKEISMRILCF